MNATFTEPVYSPKKPDFDEHTFMRQMQGVVGLLRQPAEEIISCICGYQKERLDRFQIGTAFMNDPRTLLLEEFKIWAMNRLAAAACTTEAFEKEFLFNIFRNTQNAPADCTITNLQSQQHTAMKESMATKSGQMLLLLLSTPSLR
ncbi:hypothetical protein AaE_007303, partial [Aphanomyces astaci]